MRVAVVIPCHHRLDLLSQALRAVAGWPALVVDDSPTGLALPAGVEGLRTSGELGFASAVNLGISAAAAAGATHALVLNDDAVPSPGCVDALAAAWGPDTGAVGPLLYGSDGLESAGFEELWWGRVRQRRSLGPVRDPAAEALRAGKVAEVGAISGAAMLISTESRFDPGYRHGFEDLALCRSLRQKGRKILLVPSARVMHLGGASLGRQTRQASRHAVAGHLRYLGGGWRSGLAVGLALAQVIREGGPLDRFQGVLDGVRDHRRDGDQGGASARAAEMASSKPGSNTAR